MILLTLFLIALVPAIATGTQETPHRPVSRVQRSNARPVALPKRNSSAGQMTYDPFQQMTELKAIQEPAPSFPPPQFVPKRRPDARLPKRPAPTKSKRPVLDNPHKDPANSAEASSIAWPSELAKTAEIVELGPSLCPPQLPLEWEAGTNSTMLGSIGVPVSEGRMSSGVTRVLPSAERLPAVERLMVAQANQELVSPQLLEDYANRMIEDTVESREPTKAAEVPDRFQPWWSVPVQDAMGIQAGSLPVSLEDLLASALEHSPHIQVAAVEPHIRNSQVLQESARFDWQSFLESNYTDTNDPIGNTLTTGNNESRFKQKEWEMRGGLRRRNRNGGETELSQSLGYLESNSRFLVPNHQGNARLELNYRHPLLKGRGAMVNESLIMLAEIDLNIASDDFVTNLQSHLVDVTETYWELVRSRSEYLQRKRLLARAESVLEKLEGRREVDALYRQVYRARAAVANRRAEIARSLTSIKNAEARLRLLVNDPRLLKSTGLEYTPADVPQFQRLPLDLRDAVSTAIIHRPDISKAIREVTSTTLQNGVAENELLPRLDLLLGSYVAGLDGDSDFPNSWVNQFRDGRPGFNVGFEFEIPIGNRAAAANLQRREWEVTRSLHKLRATLETGVTEVEVAVREVDTAYQEMAGRYHSMVAAKNEMEYLIDRWETLPELDDSVTLLLEDLLDSQERLADEEASFARAQFDFAVSTVQLKQVTGTLFKIEK